MKDVSDAKLKHYLTLLKESLNKNDFIWHPERIYMTETGVPLDPNDPLSFSGEQISGNCSWVC